jgi:hypothetical protein
MRRSSQQQPYTQAGAGAGPQAVGSLGCLGSFAVAMR